MADQILTDWGLHLIDVHLAMGNLLDIVKNQSRAWTPIRIPARSDITAPSRARVA